MGDVISFDEERFPVPVLEIDVGADAEVVAARIVGQFPAVRNDEAEQTIVARYIRELQGKLAAVASEHNRVCVERDRLKEQLENG